LKKKLNAIGNSKFGRGWKKLVDRTKSAANKFFDYVPMSDEAPGTLVPGTAPTTPAPTHPTTPAPVHPTTPAPAHPVTPAPARPTTPAPVSHHP
jgi:hypothetical protein